MPAVCLSSKVTSPLKLGLSHTNTEAPMQTPFANDRS
jgi:hypothetical protein